MKMRHAFRIWDKVCNGQALSMMQSQQVFLKSRYEAERQEYINEAMRLKELHADEGGLAKKMLEEARQKGEEMLRAAHQKTIEIKMVTAIRRLCHVTMEKQGRALRQWKLVNRLAVQTEGMDRRQRDLQFSRKNRMFQAGSSMLAVWVKSKEHRACVKRFRTWKARVSSQSARDQARKHKSDMKSNRVARMIERHLMSQRERLRHILRQWHVHSVHLAPVQRKHRRQSIGHGAMRAKGVLNLWRARAMKRGFARWSKLLRSDLEQEASLKDKHRATLAMKRVLKRMLNGKLWRAFRVLSLKADRHRTRSLNAIVMRSIVSRIHKSTQWRAFNKWVLSAEMQRHQLWQRETKEQLRTTLEKQQKERAATTLRGIVLRWSKKEVMRAFQTWSYHVNVGMKLHRRSMQREATLRLTGILSCIMAQKHSGTGNGANGLRSGWRRWRAWAIASAANELREQHDALCQDRAIKTIRSVVALVMHRKLARAWRQWGIVSAQQRDREYTDRLTAAIGAQNLTRTVTRVLATFCLRSLSMAMRTWAVQTKALRATELAGLRAQESGLTRMECVLRKLSHRKLYRGFLRWVRVAQAARGVEITNARVRAEHVMQHFAAGSDLLARIFGKDVPRRRMQSAFRHWAKVDRRARDTERSWEMMQEMRGSAMSRLMVRRECHEQLRVAAACWRWSAYATSDARFDGDKLRAELAKKQLKVTRLESKCTVYRSQQIRDAAVNAEFEKQLAGLRAKMRSIEENSKTEELLGRDRQRRGALMRMMSAWASREREEMRARVNRAWGWWRESIARGKHTELVQKLENKRIQSRKAAGRINSLVQRAQLERQQTAELLKSMKNRTEAMEEEVVKHLVQNATPVSPVVVQYASSPMETTTSTTTQKKKKKVRRLGKRGTGAAAVGGSPALRDPYNLIVEQILLALRSGTRTLYSHGVTDLLSLFQAIDMNADGNISDSEFHDALRRLDVQVTETQMVHLLEEMRRADGKVSFRGFVQSMRKHHRALQKIDVDKVERERKKRDTSTRRGSYFGSFPGKSSSS